MEKLSAKVIAEKINNMDIQELLKHTKQIDIDSYVIDYTELIKTIEKDSTDDDVKLVLKELNDIMHDNHNKVAQTL